MFGKIPSEYSELRAADSCKTATFFKYEKNKICDTTLAKNTILFYFILSIEKKVIANMRSEPIGSLGLTGSIIRRVGASV